MLVDEYRNNNYEIQIKDLHKFTGSDLKDNRFQRQLEPIRDQPPPEQSIAVRGRGRPLGSKNRPRDLSVDIPLKPKSLGDITMITRMGAATKPKGAVKENKSPLLRRVKDLE